MNRKKEIEEKIIEIKIKNTKIIDSLNITRKAEFLDDEIIEQLEDNILASSNLSTFNIEFIIDNKNNSVTNTNIDTNQDKNILLTYKKIVLDNIPIGLSKEINSKIELIESRLENFINQKINELQQSLEEYKINIMNDISKYKNILTKNQQDKLTRKILDLSNLSLDDIP